MRRLILILIFALLVMGWRANVTGSVGTWWRQRGHEALNTSDVEKTLSTGAQSARERMGVGELQSDARLRDWLADRMQREIPDVNGLIHEAQVAFPEYQQMAALQSWRATEADLSANLESWSEISGSDYTHLAVAVRPSWGSLGWHSCVLMGQKLPDFTPESLTDSQETLYYTECTLCGKHQACQIPRRTRSLYLECSECQRTYAMVATGSDGRYRYMNEFLEGYEPPAAYPQGQSKLAELMGIWRAVSTSCQYRQDAGTDDDDAWQTARETQSLGYGDCEDSAILLADWLLARGFEARVALGEHSERGGHAWVVVRLEGQEYLLESTEGTTGTRKVPLLSEVGSPYVPEVLFDRKAFYSRQDPYARWKGDYWSEDTWLRVEPRPVRQTAGQ